jgi:hypothetical protein
MCYYWLLCVLSSGGGKISSRGSQTLKMAIYGGVKYKLFKIKLSLPKGGRYADFEWSFWRVCLLA